MLTPNGQPTTNIEKVMLLAMWANTLKDEISLQDPSKIKKLIFAGLGKPTYPINSQTIKSYLSYWERLRDLTEKWHLNPDELQESTAIDYGDPRGDTVPRKLMAESMSSWYESEIKPENVLFTVGGIGALRVIFETFNTLYEKVPGYRLITPLPYYSAYSNNPGHRLHPIHVMNEPGYKLTAQAVEASIQEAYQLAKFDKGYPKGILICNPSNPLGNIIDEAELIKIAGILRQYPDLYIIFDEAYTEMSFVEMPSFLKIAPDLKSRTIILRSATKALSAAGERLAVLLVFEQALMNEMLNKNISYFIHAPRSAQMAYSQTMASFDVNERKKLCVFYKHKVDYVIDRLHAMGASMSDSLYKVEATFYALGNFSDLLGLELPNDARRALQKTGQVSTGEELAYYLLFKDYVMIAPLSYFGLPEKSGLIRITCSGNQQELQEMMDRLEQRLFKARKSKLLVFLENINSILFKIKKNDIELFEEILKKIAYINHGKDDCLTLKEKNQQLSHLYSFCLQKNEMMVVEV